MSQSFEFNNCKYKIINKSDDQSIVFGWFQFIILFKPDSLIQGKHVMGVSVQKLTNFYLLTTFLLFAYTFNEVYRKADNYFSAALIYLDDTVTNFIFYNMIFCIGILFYKVCILVFFEEVKENETIKLVDKLKGKIIDVILFCYIIEGEIEMNSFTCIVFIFFSYILHSMAIFRAEYLIHTPVSLSLNLNYRLTLLLLVLLFFDYQMLCYSMQLLYSEVPTHFIFAYYTITITLSLVEPTIKYFIDFYEKYTLSHIRNIDERLAIISLWVSVPRLLVQILLAILLAIKFSIFFYLMFTIIELISQLSQTVKAYNRVKKLTDTMKNLKKIDEEQIKKHHDNTCMVCFQDMVEATLLPCKHFFHDECLRQWIIKNSNHFCPKCKKQFNFDNTNGKNEVRNERREEQNQRLDDQAELNERIRRERIKRMEKLQQKIQKMRAKKKEKEQLKGFQQHSNLIESEQIKSQSKTLIAQNKRLLPQNKRLIREQIEQESSDLKLRKQNQKVFGSKKVEPQFNLRQESLQIMSWDTPLEIVELRRKKHLRMGSLAFGLPTEAVYRRTYQHMFVRYGYQRVNEDLIRDFSLREDEQMMLFADR